MIVHCATYYDCSLCFPKQGQAPHQFPSPSAFLSGTAQPPSETVESRRSRQQEELYQDRNMSTNEQRGYVFQGFMYFTVPVPWGESRATLQGAGIVKFLSILPISSERAARNIHYSVI